MSLYANRGRRECHGPQWRCVCDCAGVKPAAGLLNAPPLLLSFIMTGRWGGERTHTPSTTSAQLLRCVLLKCREGTEHWTHATVSFKKKEKKKKLLMSGKGHAQKTNPETGWHRKLAAAPPIFSHLDSVRGKDQRAYLNSPVALPCCCQSSLRPRHCRLQHCLDLLVIR